MRFMLRAAVAAVTTTMTLVVLSVQADDPEAAVKTVKVKVQRHSTVSLTNAEADRILRDMGTVLQKSDRPGDVATPIQFVRQGSVTVLPTNVSGVIQTQAQFNTLMQAGTGVKVVQRILWCGSPGGSIIGCAPRPSAVVNLAVVRFTPAQEGILWAHEFGHNCNLSHRTNDLNAIMYPSIAPNRQVVNASESANYLGGPSSVVAPTTVLALGAAQDADGFQAPKDVREFVRQHFFDGVPFEAAATYKPTDADVLLKMLADPKEDEEFLPEIVTTLCFIGSDKAVEPLINFVNGPKSTEAAFKAKHAALIHLGDLIHKTGNKQALEFLSNVASKPAVARTLAAPRVPVAAAIAAAEGVAAPTADEMASELAVSATWGLALAGKPEAEAAIKALEATPGVLQAAREMTGEAMKTCKAIQSMGQQNFYKEMKKHGESKSH